jgi:hypothetical protein
MLFHFFSRQSLDSIGLLALTEKLAIMALVQCRNKTQLQSTRLRDTQVHFREAGELKRYSTIESIICRAF